MKPFETRPLYLIVDFSDDTDTRWKQHKALDAFHTAELKYSFSIGETPGAKDSDFYKFLVGQVVALFADTPIQILRMTYEDIHESEEYSRIRVQVDLLDLSLLTL